MSKVVLGELVILACTSTYLILGRGWSLELALLAVAGSALALALLLVMVVFGLDSAVSTSEGRRAMWSHVCRVVSKDLADLWAALKF